MDVGGGRGGGGIVISLIDISEDEDSQKYGQHILRVCSFRLSWDICSRVIHKIVHLLSFFRFVIGGGGRGEIVLDLIWHSGGIVRASQKFLS